MRCVFFEVVYRDAMFVYNQLIMFVDDIDNCIESLLGCLLFQWFLYIVNLIVINI